MLAEVLGHSIPQPVAAVVLDSGASAATQVLGEKALHRAIHFIHVLVIDEYVAFVVFDHVLDRVALPRPEVYWYDNPIAIRAVDRVEWELG